MDGGQSIDWRLATWSMVFWVPAVVAVLFAAMWLLAQGPYATSNVHGGERAWVLIAAAVAVAMALVGSIVLARSEVARRRSLGLGLAGSAITTGIAACCVAFVVLRWAW